MEKIISSADAKYILISYNITSKISLEQVDSKNKIPKLGIINIIEGALTALEDIEEFDADAFVEALF